MLLEDFFDITHEPYHSIRLKGTRIGLEDIVMLHNMNMTPMQIVHYFSCPPKPVLVFAAITYYLSHTIEIDDYILRCELLAESQRKEWEAMGPSDLRKKLLAEKAQRAAALS
jgi:uncharacterized protein (DUF433 family)